MARHALIRQLPSYAFLGIESGQLPLLGRGHMLAPSLIVVLSAALLTATPQAQKVRIFVGTYEPPGQYLEPGAQDRADSARDIENTLKMIPDAKRFIELLKDRATADVVVEVVGRTVAASGGQVTTVVPTGFGGFVASTHPGKIAYVFAWLRAGQFERQLAGTGGRWSSAGNNLAHQVLDWVKVNQKAILSDRE
jgi:hypothetical protein